MIRFVDLRDVPNAQAAEWMVDLAADLRPEDLAEIEATSDLSPAETLVTSLMLSDHAWVILVNEEPVCVFGAAPSGTPSSGLVWMMGSPRMDTPAVALAVLRATRPYLDAMHVAYPHLWNMIDARHDKSMKWLEWCGFSVVDVHPAHGRQGRLFYTFSRLQPPCAIP